MMWAFVAVATRRSLHGLKRWGLYIYIAPWGGGEGERGFDDVHSFLIASSANRRVPRGLYFEIFHAKWGLGKGDLFLFPWVNLR